MCWLLSFYVYGVRDAMKKLLVLMAFFAVSSGHQVFGMSYVKNLIHSNDVLGKKIVEISRDVYPHAVAYFNKMKAKYPEALTDVSIVIAEVSGPWSSSCVIMFPRLWVEQLEAEIKNSEITQVQDVIEWALLHEAGHVKKEHLAKIMVATIVTCALSAYTVWKLEYFTDYSTVQRFFIKYGIYVVAANLLNLTEKIAYSRYVMEPEADDFANELCDNPQAFEQAIKWLQGNCGDDILHPTIASRIEKIKQAALKKFGKPEMIVAQA